MKNRAKIIATIGPASQEKDIIKQLLEAGMDVARLNFSHGTHQEHSQVIANLRQAAAELDRPVTILQDLSGPKIRTGEMKDGPVELIQGREMILTTRDVPGTAEMVHVNFPALPKSVSPGGRILLDDGKLELKVKSTQDPDVVTEVIQGGILKAHKGVNLPGTHLQISSLTEKDREDLAFGLEKDVDVLALSFVRSADDIHQLREAIQSIRPERADIPVIAKLEHPDAIKNLDEIIHAADGVMVARGDLGIEMPPESVPIEQKQIIATANKHLCFVITATQMLESMISNPRPTRAEASDVANAVLDGSDAVMLSGETAVGEFPVKAVQMMASIICQSEEHSEQWGRMTLDYTLDMAHDDAISITRAARELAQDRAVSAVAVFTQSGRTARLMSKARPNVPILAFTPEERTYRYLSMLWGTTPYLIPHADSIEGMISHVDKAVIEGTPVQPGQEIVLIAGFPIHKMVPPNLALLHTVSSH
ncbi:MAG: pyruvate kinase [Anaerolineales bacterium]|jgi:pyruvate kinase